LIKSSFQGLSVAIKTMGIVKEMMEIWLNEVCDTVTSLIRINIGQKEKKIASSLFL